MLRSHLCFFAILRSPETDTGGGGGGDIVLGGDSTPKISDTPEGGKPPGNAMLAKELSLGDKTEDDTKTGDKKDDTKTGDKKDDTKTSDKKDDTKNDEDPWPNKQAFLDAIGAKDIKPGDKRLEQWDHVKGMLKKATDLNSAQAIRLATLEKDYASDKATLQQELAEAKAAVKDGTGTPADVKAIQADLAALKTKYETESKELQDYKAKDDIRNNSAFKQKYEGGRASLFEGAKEAAKEAGVTDEQLNKVFGAKSEYEMRKALDALEIKDATALALVKEKATEYVKLTAEMDGLLSGKSGKSPSEVLAEWKGYEAQLGGSMTQRFTAELQGRALDAVKGAKAALAESNAFFKTDGGDAILESLEARIREGYDIPMDEVIQSIALAETAPIWEKLYYEQNDKVRALEAQVAQLTGTKPSTRTATPPAGDKNDTRSVSTQHDPFRPSTGDEIILGAGNRMVG